MKTKYSRKIVIDIETTGMNKVDKIYKNHKIIEIGAIEIIDRSITSNTFHKYLNPNQEVSDEAFKIHGISNSFLKNKPIFLDIYDEFINYIKNSEIVVHNEGFDISFLDYEIKNINNKFKKISKICNIIDTLKIARDLFPGKKNNLDALCKRYNVLNVNRKLHSALNDSKLLSEIYLRMTRVQKNIDFSHNIKNEFLLINNNDFDKKLKVLKTSLQEKEKHIEYLNNMKNYHKCLWIK
ncbi:DNA polymerase III subunit epsilon [Buchnera aphidicola]|uniref:DNA polymerase III subunit epsilon n=1 Tax=Buchnera aphidicola TaxID=9 RepID=UPI003463991B